MKQNLITSNIPYAFVPGSRALRDAELKKANEVLQKAKNLNRKVRYAPAGECSFTKAQAKKKKEAAAVITGPYTTDQAASYLGITRSMMTTKFQKGIISGTVTRRRAYFEKEELDRYLDSQKKENQNNQNN